MLTRGKKHRDKETIIGDLAKIENAINEGAYSLEQVTKATGLTYQMIQATLVASGSKERVYELLKQSKKKYKNKPEILEKKEIVIDASVAGNTEIVQNLKEAISKGNKVVITSATNRELKMLARTRDSVGITAGIITSLAAEDPENFICKRVEPILNESVDDAIVKFCKQEEGPVELWSGDKEMVLNARSFGINARYFAQIESSNGMMITENPNIRTLYDADYENNRLIIKETVFKNKCIEVTSDAYIYDVGPIELKVGDDIYIAKFNKGKIKFIHYKVISLEPVNNAELVYQTELRGTRRINKVPKDYQVFLREAIYRFDISRVNAKWI